MKSDIRRRRIISALQTGFGGGGGSPVPDPEAIGQLFTDSFADLDEWTNVGLGTNAITADGLQISNGNSYARRLYQNFGAFTGHKWKISVRTRCDSAGTVAFGVRSEQALSTARNWFVEYNQATSNMAIVFGTSAQVNAASGAAASTGEWIQLTLERHFMTMIATFYNETSGVYRSCTFTTIPVNAPNTCHFAIMNISGTYTVNNYTVSSRVMKNVPVMMIGDSITVGSGNGTASTDYYSSWPNQLMADTENFYEQWAGGGDYTDSVLAAMPYLVELRPRVVLLMIGGNDILYGVASGTWQANYTSIVSQLSAAGIRVINCYSTPRTTEDIRAVNTYINSNYADKIDTFTPLLEPATDYDLAAIYDSGDGRHPNTAGYTEISDTIFGVIPTVIGTSSKSAEFLKYLHTIGVGMATKYLNAIETYIDAEVAAGNFSLIGGAYIGCMSDSELATIGIKSEYRHYPGGANFVVESGYHFDGVSTFSDSMLFPSKFSIPINNTAMTFVVDNNNSLVTSAIVGARVSAGTALVAAQRPDDATPDLVYNAMGSSRIFTGADAGKYANLALYTVRRGTGDVFLYKNGSQVDTATIAASAALTRNIFFGCNHSETNTRVQFADVELVYFALFNESGFNIAAHHTNVANLITACKA